MANSSAGIAIDKELKEDKEIVKNDKLDGTRMNKKLELPEERSQTPRHNIRGTADGRVLRNRRNRRFFDDHRHTKRLFTPEIKKFLKDWLIRRRDHPYPNRDEKKDLAVQTGLTYVQICNWFANWRRKLKNAGCEEQRTWSHLIKSYNTQAEGNVEQFSISSDDSIWERRELIDADDMEDEDDKVMKGAPANSTAMDHCYSSVMSSSGQRVDAISVKDVVEEVVVSAMLNQAQCLTVSSTTTEDDFNFTSHSKLLGNANVDDDRRMKWNMDGKYTTVHMIKKAFPSEDVPSLGKRKRHKTEGGSHYKRQIMEKYMKDMRLDGSVERNKKRQRCAKHDKRTSSSNGSVKKAKEFCAPKVLSKWLESAAKFQPSKSYVPWTPTKIIWPKKSRRRNPTGDLKVPPVQSIEHWAASGHQRAELDAAEALTCLSGAGLHLGRNN